MRVYGRIAGVSEATYISLSPIPMTSGLAPLRANTRWSGSSLEITPKRVRAAHLVQRATHRLDDTAAGLGRPVVHLDQMRENFRVGFALEDVAEFDQAGSQRGVVFDDPIVDHGDLSVAVHMRMGVGIGGTAVGRPARMPDADRSG